MKHLTAINRKAARMEEVTRTEASRPEGAKDVVQVRRFEHAWNLSVAGPISAQDQDGPG